MGSKQVFNVGVIGYGASAKIFHIPFIAVSPAFQLHSILQRAPKAGDSAPADYPTLQHHRSLDPFLADPRLDLVVVTTPPPSHFALASAALRARKHVLVEKPFVPTAVEAEQLAALARAQGRHVCVYQNRRWDADFLTVRRLLAEGALGDVLEFETHIDKYRAEKPTGWKVAISMDEGGGQVYDLGSHLIDQVYALFGLPTSVFAKLVSQHDGGAFAVAGNGVQPDSVNAQLFYEKHPGGGSGGMTALVRIGVRSAEARQLRFWVRGRDGSFRKHGADPQEDQLIGGMGVTDPAFGRVGPEWDGVLATFASEADRAAGKVVEKTYPTVEPATYAALYDRFGEALRSGREEDVPVPATQARDVLRIIEAARRSADEGREIRLDREASPPRL